MTSTTASLLASSESTFGTTSTTRSSFVPGFLVNDIVRFWKTLCLNYEFDRGTHAAELQKDPTLRRAFRLKNLKLSFSRLMTCYSALVLLAAIHQKGATHPNEVRQLVEHSPTERLEMLVEMQPDTARVRISGSRALRLVSRLPRQRQGRCPRVARRY